ncbi:conserved hypothetical protein [Culex quinquefasciatus]|uniref:LIM zinc-binding domain-containing protein n=1 Tax=Culex quinquefasciatus TaxID=7176 RepID=B0WQ55_CULQU|nr:conserved hypothetical protein [Culex quinquefasciatus]|eukprot:XP_001850839.1 conserved hypothetical protein [Culex quinquefasciatus]
MADVDVMRTQTVEVKKTRKVKKTTTKRRESSDATGEVTITEMEQTDYQTLGGQANAIEDKGWSTLSAKGKKGQGLIPKSMQPDLVACSSVDVHVRNILEGASLTTSVVLLDHPNYLDQNSIALVPCECPIFLPPRWLGFHDDLAGGLWKRILNSQTERFAVPNQIRFSSCVRWPTHRHPDDDDDESQVLPLIFSGEYTKAMSKDWHSGHFCCWQCDESLTGQRYVLRDEHPYCIKCYENVFANVCEECNKTIGIDSKLSQLQAVSKQLDLI